MKLLFLGGADEVGGSCMIVEIAGHRLLVDCGIRMGSNKDKLPWLAKIQEVGGVEAIVVTHGHTDHIGALPVVYKDYPVPIITTDATGHLMKILFRDALKIMGMNRDEGGEIPLYSQEMVEKVLAGIAVTPVGKIVLCFDDALRITFYPSGHILGACSVVFESKDETLLVTGDVSVTDQLTVPGMKIPSCQPDVMVMESTYGGRMHASRSAEENRLIEQAAEVIYRGGSVLYPAFAIGRAQEVILILSRAMEEGKLQRTAIFVDGMVRQVCQAYRSLPEHTSDWMSRRITRYGDPFFYQGSPAIAISRKSRESVANIKPAIFVSSSGMLTGGPSQMYARVLAKDPKSLIAITGYQDEESPGRAVQEVARNGGGNLFIGGERVELKCQVATYGLSAHADESQLVELARALKVPEIVLVHGDYEARMSLTKALGSLRGRVHNPALGEALEFQVNPRKRFSEKSSDAVNLKELSRRRKVITQPSVRRTSAAAPSFPKMAQKPVQQLDQARSMEITRRLFPVEANLYKIGAPNGTLVLYFGIPRKVEEQYAEQIERLRLMTGRTVRLAETPNGNALIKEAQSCLPPDWHPVRPTKVQGGKQKQVIVFVDEPEPDVRVIEEAATQFQRWTGFELVIEGTVKKSSLLDLVGVAGDKMKADEARIFVPLRLQGIDHELLKIQTRATHGGSYLEVTFITPEIGKRYRTLLDGLEKETGWQITVRPTCDQQRVREAAKMIVPSDWNLRKEPRVVDLEGAVHVAIDHSPSREEAKKVCAEFHEATGYRLFFS